MADCPLLHLLELLPSGGALPYLLHQQCFQSGRGIQKALGVSRSLRKLHIIKREREMLAFKYELFIYLQSRGHYPLSSGCKGFCRLNRKDQRETLLRLLLPLNGKVSRLRPTPRPGCPDRERAELRGLHRTVRSVGATGGVYKGQGRNQRGLMTRAY